MNKYNKIGFVNGSAPALNADNLNHMDEGIEQATDGVIAVEEDIKTARGDYESVGERLDNLIPDEMGAVTTFNIADGAVITQIIADGAITSSKLAANLKATIANKLDKMPFDSEPQLNSPCYLTSGAVYNALTAKYDASNIESGTSALTPYSTVTDKIKSATCTYKTIGDVVLIDVDIVMNAVTMGANSSYPLIDLPYKNVSTNAKYFVGISSGNKLLKGSVPKNNTWLQFSAQDKTAYTFADGEQINFSLFYKIK